MADVEKSEQPMIGCFNFLGIAGLAFLFFLFGGIPNQAFAFDEQGKSVAGESIDSQANAKLKPSWRKSYDCGRMATYNFVNLIREVPFHEVAGRVPIEGSKGSSLASICDCLSDLGVDHRARWLKPGELGGLQFPIILRLKNMGEQYHFLVVVKYDHSKDEFWVLDGETDQIQFLDGKNIRLRSTGFIVESFHRDWYRTPLFFAGLLCFGVVLYACFLPRRGSVKTVESEAK